MYRLRLTIWQETSWKLIVGWWRVETVTDLQDFPQTPPSVALNVFESFVFPRIWICQVRLPPSWHGVELLMRELSLIDISLLVKFSTSYFDLYDYLIWLQMCDIPTIWCCAYWHKEIPAIPQRSSNAISKRNKYKTCPWGFRPLRKRKMYSG